ncbi:MAG TPA: adenylate/guanylate cyclase domain-containing protein [Actinomycetota bacterium]|nr:adenylate/guanylate cyclase domain-containing protein [Actinomycetota bacterium]
MSAHRGPGRALPTGTVTFLFTDIEGSTTMLRDLGRERYRRVEDEHAVVLRRAFDEGGGRVIRTEGDSFFAVFPTASGALRAAVAAQRTVAGHRFSHGRDLRVRIGMHTGEAHLGGGDYVGMDVNRAARIAAAGHGGQVLLSEATKVLVEQEMPPGVSVRDVGHHQLKDVGTERIFDLVIDGLSSEFPPLRSLEVPTSLPPQRTSFVGRAEEVRTLVGLLRSERLITLLGPGGTGKTRLAIRAAEEALPAFADGVVFVDLSAIRDTTVVPSAIAKGLGLPEDPVRPPLEAATAFLAGRAILLVLDNFEQVAEAAPLVDRLLDAAPGTAVLVTSRVRLGLSGEHAFAVTPLDAPAPEEGDPARLAQNEAVALFVDRARAARGSFALDADNARAVAEICTRVEGLPLAIELAAVHTRVLLPAEIAARLGQRLGALGSGPRTAPERQRTVLATIAWSHDLLPPPHRTLFSRLAVFPAGATLDAMEAVCDPDRALGGDALEVLAGLVDHSLVHAVETPEGSRFRMLETIREFAMERLEERGEAAGVRARHAAFFAELAERAAPHLTASDREAWLDRLDGEHQNIQAALRWSTEADRGDVGLRLAASLWRFWQIRGHVREGRPLVAQVLGLPSSSPRTPGRVGALLAAGSMAYWQDDVAGARAPYEEAVALARASGDPALIAEALFHLAYVEGLEGRFDVAERLFAEAASIRDELADRRGRAWVDVGRSQLLGIQGRSAETVEILEAALPVFLEAGDQFGVENAQGALAAAAYHRGDLDRAEDLTRTALTRAREWANAGVGIAGMATLALARGDATRSIRLWGAFEGLLERAWGDAHPPWALLPLGDTRQEAAARLPEEAAAAAREEGRRMSFEDAVRYAMEG